MKRLLTIAQLTSLSSTPPQLIDLAADLACDAVGVRLLPAAPGGTHYPLWEDPAMLRETLARVERSGVGIIDLEVLRIGADFEVSGLSAFFDTGARLGARHVLVAGDDAVEDRLIDNYAALCLAAAPYGLTCDLEFMPWTAVRDGATATRIVEAAAQPNGGILIDALHWSRSATSAADIAAMPPSRLHYVQICDGVMPGPVDTARMIFDARCERLLPGEGGIALDELLRLLPAELAVSVEIPNDRRAEVMGQAMWVKSAVDASRALLERAS